MNVIVAANEEKFREAKEMCEALRKLMQDELEAERLDGEESGKHKVNKLVVWKILSGQQVIRHTKRNYLKSLDCEFVKDYKLV